MCIVKLNFYFQIMPDHVLAGIIITVLVLLRCCNTYSSTSCSNRGYIYADTPNKCVCDNCYSGKNCELEIPNCIIIDTGGDPLLYQSYWQQVQVEQSPATIDIISSYRTGYEFNSEILIDGRNDPDSIGPVLNDAIRNLHNVIGNAETKGYSIVLGCGGTQLIAASTWAFTQIAAEQGVSPVTVFAKTPYYGGYRNYASTHPTVTQWNDSYTQQAYQERIIEFVNVPRNPTGTVEFEPIYNETKYIAYV
jgi:hypothetical protein